MIICEHKGNVENTNRRRVSSTFIECSQMTGVFYHRVIHGLGFFICFMHLSMLSRWRGRPGKGGGFDSNHRPVVGFFDRFNGLFSNTLLTFSCYFDKPQCPGVRHLNGTFQLCSNPPPMPGLPPPQRLNIDRCIKI